MRGEAPPTPPIAPAHIPFIGFVPFTTRYQRPNTIAYLDTMALHMKAVRDSGGHLLLSMYSCPAELVKDPWIGHKRAEKVMHEMMRLTDLKPDFFYVTTLTEEIPDSSGRCTGAGIFPRGLRE